MSLDSNHENLQTTEAEAASYAATAIGQSSGLPSRASQERSSTNDTDTVNLTISGRGGIGKTTSTKHLAEHLCKLDETGKQVRNVVCIDADPKNRVFSTFESLRVQSVNLFTDDRELNVREIDKLFGRTLAKDVTFVVDVGSNLSEQFANYLLRDDMLSILAEEKRFIVHVVIAGGALLEQTFQAANDIITKFPRNVDFVIWLNPHTGPLVTLAGTPVERTKEFRPLAEQAYGIVRIPDSRLVRDATVEMLARGMTFGDVAKSDIFEMSAKIRLAGYWKSLSKQIEAAIGE